jgi:hypothetical protein
LRENDTFLERRVIEPDKRVLFIATAVPSNYRLYMDYSCAQLIPDRPKIEAATNRLESILALPLIEDLQSFLSSFDTTERHYRVSKLAFV